MEKIDKKNISKEMVQKALTCESAEELLAMAKAEGYEMTEDEAKAYFAELQDFELDNDELKNVAGGGRDPGYLGRGGC